MNDINSAIFIIVFTITENTGIQDSYTVVSDYLQSITEAVTLLDKLCYNGWFRIDDSQSAGWTAITTPSGVWIDVNDAQAAGWGTIDTSQPCS
jgi:hypothetical protein